jgi:hypothetical protein
VRGTAAAVVLFFAVAGALRADLSFTVTRKRTGGASVAGRDSISKFFLKGDKLKMERADRVVILDFRAGTLQILDERTKTVSAGRIEPAKSGKRGNEKIETRETTQPKTTDGNGTRELTLSTTLDSPELERAAMAIRMEMTCSVVRDGAGIQELRDFYRRNGTRIPWKVLGGDGDSSIEDAIASLKRAVSALPAVAVLEVITLKPANGGLSQGKLQATPAQATKIREAMSELDATVQKGGPEAETAARSLAIMNAVVAPERRLDDSGALFEITLQSSGFSGQPIPDSVFAIPAGYTSKPVGDTSK